MEDKIIIPNRVSKVDVDKLIGYNKNKPKGVDTLERFTDVLTEKLGISQEDWLPYISKIEADVVWLEKKKRYNEKRASVHIMNYENDCVKLQMYSLDDNTVELGWIEINQRCKGVGTYIMNCILDTADDLGINVRVLPVDFDCGNVEPLKYLKWLRSWYKSFGFKPYSQFTPALKYFAKK